MMEHPPNHDPFKEVKFISPFVSSKLAYENEQPSPPSLKPKQCPSGHPNVVLNRGQDSTDVSLENENFFAMDMLLSTPCPYEEHNHPSLLVCKLFGRMVVDAYVYHKYCKSRGCTLVLTLQLE